VKFIVLFALGFPAAYAAAVPSQTENSVVQIAVVTAVPGGGPNVSTYGTGFFVRDDGLVATASHVYLKAMNAIVDARAGVLIARRVSRTDHSRWLGTPIDLVAEDYSHDVVLLKLRAVDPQWKEYGGVVPLALETTSKMDDDASVGMRGYFGSDSFPIFLEGKISGSTDLGPAAVQELLIVLPVAPGHSGSPLISMETGRVVGIITAIVPVALPFNPQPVQSGLARAIEVEHLNALVESLTK
jgi:hypothetical protein